MVEDYELPVWGVRPNWAQPILETLTWQTQVLRSMSGAEQRLALRLAPRRMMEARYNPFENERTFVDLVMHKLARQEWMMPLWFDRSTLNAQAVAATSRIDCATQYREFVAGGMAYLVGPDTFTGEAVRISAVDSTGLDLEVPLGSSWPAGTSIHPMRRGWFDEANQGLLTSRIGESNIRFEMIEGNDLGDEGTWETVHSDGLPVLTREPEWSETIELDLSWLGDTFDSQTGQRYVTDTAGRAFRQQAHSFILFGAQERFEYRQMLYRLRGQQRPVWLPTFSDDVEFAQPANAGVTQIDVRQMGLSYIGGPTDGRDRLYFSGGQIAEISAASIVGGTQNERLTLSSALAINAMAGDRASFIERARLAQDSVEIEHLGDTDGVARSTLSFAGYAERRVATTATQPIPTASEEVTPCGLPAEENACNTFNFFEGYYYVALLTLSGLQQTPGQSNIIIDLIGSDGLHGGGTTFQYNNGGAYDPSLGLDRQYQVDGNEIYCYFVKDVGNPLELFLQLQRQGGSENTMQLRRWNTSFSGPLMIGNSQFFTPVGSPSNDTAGKDSWNGAGLFPGRYYFGV